LEANIESLKDEGGLPPVRVNGLDFKSADGCETFLKANKATEYALIFVDIVSLLQIAEAHSATSAALVSTAQASKKIGVDDPIQVEAFHSLGVVVPFAFGVTIQATKKDSQGLPAFPTYDSFAGSGAVKDGGRKAIAEGVNQAMTPLRESIGVSNMSPEAKSVARTLLSDSKDHVISYMQFLKEEHDNQRSLSSLSARARWSYVCTLGRIVFDELYKVRNGPSRFPLPTAHSPTVAGKILWSTLQCHRLMNEFVHQDFRLHPSIAPVLTNHLLEIGVFSDQFDALAKRVDNLEKNEKKLGDEVASQKKTTDRLATKTGQTGKGGKKGKDGDSG
jgi:hypothetical protein